MCQLDIEVRTRQGPFTRASVGSFSFEISSLRADFYAGSFSSAGNRQEKELSKTGKAKSAFELIRSFYPVGLQWEVEI
jgi:hypothetical protein